MSNGKRAAVGAKSPRACDIPPCATWHGRSTARGSQPLPRRRALIVRSRSPWQETVHVTNIQMFGGGKYDLRNVFRFCRQKIRKIYWSLLWVSSETSIDQSGNTKVKWRSVSWGKFNENLPQRSIKTDTHACVYIHTYVTSGKRQMEERGLFSLCGWSFKYLVYPELHRKKIIGRISLILKVVISLFSA